MSVACMIEKYGKGRKGRLEMQKLALTQLSWVAKNFCLLKLVFTLDFVHMFRQWRLLQANALYP